MHPFFHKIASLTIVTQVATNEFWCFCVLIGCFCVFLRVSAYYLGCLIGCFCVFLRISMEFQPFSSPQRGGMSIEMAYPTSCTPAECYVNKKVATCVIIVDFLLQNDVKSRAVFHKNVNIRKSNQNRKWIVLNYEGKEKYDTSFASHEKIWTKYGSWRH